MPRKTTGLSYRPSDELIATAKQARYGGNPKPPAPVPPSPLINQCTERINQLTSFCSEEYNIDPLHTRLLMSVLLPTRHMPTWLIAESTRTPFWTHMNFCMDHLGLPKIFDVASLRGMRWQINPGGSQAVAQEWLETRNDQPRLFIDGHRHQGRTFAKIGPGHGYWRIAQECIRVTMPIPMLRVPAAGTEEELLRLVRRVMEGTVDSTKRVWPEPVELSKPLAEIIDALPKLNPELSDGEIPFTAFSLLPSGHAALYGRTSKQLIDADWLNLMQCIRGSIRQWLRDILYWFYMADAKTRMWVDMRTMGENLGIPYTKWGPGDTVRWRLAETDRMGVTESKLMKSRHWNKRRMYALTDLGMLGASVVGAGPGVRWW